MKINLLHNTPLWVASTAIRKCWASEDKSDTEDPLYMGYSVEDMDFHTGTKDKALIHRVGNKNKHSSTLEHLNYSFDIDGISRACLQEVARHRHASISVKSTRYTLKELKKYLLAIDTTLLDRFLCATGNEIIDRVNVDQLRTVMDGLEQGLSNDNIKYMLPEAYKTSLVLTINARSLQNFLSLRTDKSALWEIQDLAHELYNQLPDEHKYLFEEFVKENK